MGPLVTPLLMGWFEEPVRPCSVHVDYIFIRKKKTKTIIAKIVRRKKSRISTGKKTALGI